MRRTKSSYLFWLLMVVTLDGINCSSSVGRQIADTTKWSQDIDAQEREVSAAVLNDLYVGHNTKLLVINDETSLDWLTAEHINKDLAFLRQGNWHEIGSDILNDFFAKNAQPRTITDQINLNVKLLILSKDEVAAIGQSPDQWKQFLEKYPGQSIITLSRAGFSANKNYALIYTGDQSGGRTGRGQYVFLGRENGMWIIKYKVLAWAS